LLATFVGERVRADVFEVHGFSDLSGGSLS
jgi:hypothetical protein